MRSGRRFFLVVTAVFFMISATSLEEATAHYIATLYQKKRYSEVSVEARNYVGKFPLSRQFSRVAILGGEAAYKEKNYHLGRYFFEQAFKKTSENQELRQALLGIAKCSYKLGSYAEAMKFFETYVREFDDPIVNPAALYYAYASSLAAGRYEETKRYREWLATRYPDSPYLSLVSSEPLPQTEKNSLSQPPRNLPPLSSSQTPSSSLNEVALTVPQLVQREHTNMVVLTNWITLSNQIVGESQRLPQSSHASGEVRTSSVSMDENERFLSLLEVKARLLQLKGRTLDEELAALGIGGNP